MRESAELENDERRPRKDRPSTIEIAEVAETRLDAENAEGFLEHFSDGLEAGLQITRKRSEDRSRGRKKRTR